MDRNVPLNSTVDTTRKFNIIFANQYIRSNEPLQQEELRRQAEAREVLTNLLQEQRRQEEAREDKQRRQAEAGEEKLIQALTKEMTSTGALFPVAPGSIPKFTAFDATVELWKDYLAQFTMFVGANSIPAKKTNPTLLPPSKRYSMIQRYSHATSNQPSIHQR